MKLRWVVVVAFAAVACKKEPCGGRGMEVDPRPMTADWKEHMGAPEGAVLCRATGESDAPNQRQYAFPEKTPAQVLSLWRDAMKEAGWKQVGTEPSKGPTASHCTTEVSYEKDKLHAKVSVSECEGRAVKGWSTVYLTP